MQLTLTRGHPHQPPAPGVVVRVWLTAQLVEPETATEEPVPPDQVGPPGGLELQTGSGRPVRGS